MNPITITIKLFGVFRCYGSAVVLELPANSSAAAVKQALSEVLDAPEKALVADAVLAYDNSILPDTHIFNETCQLAILPPVCGG